MSLQREVKDYREKRMGIHRTRFHTLGTVQSILMGASHHKVPVILQLTKGVEELLIHKYKVIHFDWELRNEPTAGFGRGTIA